MFKLCLAAAVWIFLFLVETNAMIFLFLDKLNLNGFNQWLHRCLIISDQQEWLATVAAFLIYNNLSYQLLCDLIVHFVKWLEPLALRNICNITGRRFLILMQKFKVDQASLPLCGHEIY